jgi:hypothetical protein
LKITVCRWYPSHSMHSWVSAGTEDTAHCRMQSGMLTWFSALVTQVWHNPCSFLIRYLQRNRFSVEKSGKYREQLMFWKWEGLRSGKNKAQKCHTYPWRMSNGSILLKPHRMDTMTQLQCVQTVFDPDKAFITSLLLITKCIPPWVPSAMINLNNRSIYWMTADKD